MINKIFQDLVI